MRTEDLHDQVCLALQQAGGKPAESIPSRDTNLNIADVVFEEERAIIEVKSLTSDRARDDDITERIGAIIMKWAQRSRAPVIFGDVVLKLADLEPPVAMEIARLLGARIRKLVGKANKQIKSTAAQLGWTEFIGLPLIVLPAHFVTHPGLVAHAAHDALRDTTRLTSVHGIVVITVPVDDGPPMLPPGELVIAHFSRAGHRAPPGLIERVSRSWASHLAADRGEPPGTVRRGTDDEFLDRFSGPPIADTAA